MRAYSNVVPMCPWNVPFEINKMPVNGNIFENPFLPVGKYYMNITERAGSLASSTWLWSGQFHFTIPEGRSIENDSLGR